MAWVVDTCLIIDVLDDDPAFGAASARLIDSKAPDGLVACPVTFIELAPAFLGDIERQQHFLNAINVDCDVDWTWLDTQHAFDAWQRHATRRRAGRVRKRPVADIQIGAFATRFQGLLTRNPDDFSLVFPHLPIVSPQPDLSTRDTILQ